MTLLYDNFQVRRVEVILDIWPGFDRLLPGQLSRLIGPLNDDDSFTSSEIQPESGLRLEGEQWVYDLSLSSVMLRSRSFLNPSASSPRMRSLLEVTRGFFGGRQPVGFYTDLIRVVGYIPDDKGRNIGEVVQGRLLKTVTKEDREALPGLAGAGLRLIGDAEDYHWHASIEPPHGAYESLSLYGELMFYPGAWFPGAWPGPRCDRGSASGRL